MIISSTGNWRAFWPWNAGNAEWYYITDSWTPKIPVPISPLHIGYNNKKNYHVNDRYLQDVIYPIKQLTLNYRVPSEIVDQIGVHQLTCIWSKPMGSHNIELLDPEVRPTLTQEYYQIELMPLVKDWHNFKILKNEKFNKKYI